MGWDRRLGFQLYQSDPSGNYSGWKATCIGNNSVVCKLLSDFFFSAEAFVYNFYVVQSRNIALKIHTLWKYTDGSFN